MTSRLNQVACTRRKISCFESKRDLDGKSQCSEVSPPGASAFIAICVDEQAFNIFTCKQIRRMRMSLEEVFSTSGRSTGVAHTAFSVGNHGAPSTDQLEGSKGTKYPEKTHVMPSKG